MFDTIMIPSPMRRKPIAVEVVALPFLESHVYPMLNQEVRRIKTEQEEDKAVV